MDIYITGGAWISADGYGRMSEGKNVSLSPGPPVMPPGKEVFSRPHQRYGRFDTFTKLGCAAVALTLQDAGMKEEEQAGGTGMVVSTLYEVMETDKAYYQTTLEQGGILSSPNLFSYTLPVIVLGECAVLFHLTGPTFCVGDSGGKGINALQSAAGMISSGKAERMIAGWIDAPPPDIAEGNRDEAVSGAVFIILDAKPCNMLFSRRKLTFKDNGIFMDNGREIFSLLDLFSNCGE